MPYLRKVPYPDGTHIYLWELNESPAELTAQCKRRGLKTLGLRPSMARSRQCELLVESLLLHIIFGEPVELRHLPGGQPYVTSHHDVHISVSHTHSLVCVAINAHHRIGIDVETWGTRVLRVRDKFLSAAEQQFVAPGDTDSHLVAWTAKEALYKAHGQAGVSLTADLSLEPFKSLGGGTLTLHAHCQGEKYELRTTAWSDHMITLAYRVADIDNIEKSITQ